MVRRHLIRAQGVVPNFANPPFMGLPVIVTAAVCLPFVVLFASIRLYAKWSLLRKWKLEDCMFAMDTRNALLTVSRRLLLSMCMSESDCHELTF
jgi:hypothetical protein